MNKFSAALAACCFLFAAKLDAQTTLTANPGQAQPAPAFPTDGQPVDATISVTPAVSPPLAAISSQHRFSGIGVMPGELVDLSVRFPVAKVRHIISAEPLDGGTVLGVPGGLTVASDGTIHLKFQVDTSPGIRRLVLRDKGAETQIEFWVFDTQHPENNPPVANGGN